MATTQDVLEKQDELNSSLEDFKAKHAKRLTALEQKTEENKREAVDMFVRLSRPGEPCAKANNLIDVRKTLAAIVSPGSEFAQEVAEASRKCGGPVLKGAYNIPLSGNITVTKAVSNPSGASYLNQSVVLPLLDALREKSQFWGIVARQTVQGSVVVPTKDSTAAGSWIALNGSNTISVSNPVFKSLSLSPRFVAAISTYVLSENYLNGSNNLESILMEDLAAALATAVDSAILNGVGTTQPLGILNTVGIDADTFSGTTPTYAELLEMQTALLVANVDLAGAGVRYVCTPAIAAALKVLPKATGEFSGFALEGGRIDGIQTIISNHVPATKVILADFGQYLMCDWGSLSLLADPYSELNTGGVKVRGLLAVDGGMRHAKAASVYTKTG